MVSLNLHGVSDKETHYPFIFCIICLELLSLKLFEAANKPKFGIGIKFSPGDQKIPCMMFANDCLIFSKANFSTCCTLKYILEEFCNVSGQMINFHNASLTFPKNATHAQKYLASGILNITRSDSLGKYLGCPAFQGRPKMSTFQDLLSRTVTRLEGWKANCLSKAVRTVLIL